MFSVPPLIVNSQQFLYQTQVLLYLLAGLEKQRHCCYISCLLPQHSAPFTAQSCQAESIINFSHVAIDPIFVEKSSQLSPTSLSSISLSIKCAVISWEMHVKLSTACSAWQPELFLYILQPLKLSLYNFSSSSTKYTMWFYNFFSIIMLMRSKRACNIQLGSYVALNVHDHGW